MNRDLSSPIGLFSHRPRFIKRLVAVLVVDFAFFFVLALAYGADPVANESGPMENSQAALLFLTAIVFLVTALRVRASTRMLAVGLSVFSLVLFFREFQPQADSPITDYLRSSSFRIHETIVVLTIAAAYCLARWRYVGIIARYFLSPKSRYFYVAAVFVVIAAIFEKLAMFTPHHAFFEFLEELFESNGYITYLFMALFALTHWHRVPDDGRPSAS